MKYLFDLDETLIHSDSLNCDAYNYALEKCGYPRIEDCLRLTRDSLQFIPASDLKKIIRIKQNYFTRSWLPYRIVLNTALLQRIRGYGKKNCYLWTSASKQRAQGYIEIVQSRRRTSDRCVIFFRQAHSRAFCHTVRSPVEHRLM